MGSKASFRLILVLSAICAGMSLGQGGQVIHTLAPLSNVLSTGAHQFAIGDFDGDHKPDLAEVQVGRTDSLTTQYSIRVNLTSGSNQSIPLTAPFGGLQIVTRDVNGDNAPDLVISSNLEHLPVTILLNDGHGNFSPAEPASFPGAFSESRSNLRSTAANQVIDAVGVPPRSNNGLPLQAAALFHVRRYERSIAAAIPGFVFSEFLASHAGRAPPARIFRS